MLCLCFCLRQPMDLSRNHHNNKLDKFRESSSKKKRARAKANEQSVEGKDWFENDRAREHKSRKRDAYAEAEQVKREQIYERKSQGYSVGATEGD